MLAAVIEGPGAVVVRETTAPRAAGLALVRVAQAGVCGTDRKLAAGVMPVTPPRVLGHEMTGWVEVPAPGGTVPAGTPVVVNPAVFCGMCRECRADRPNLCARGSAVVVGLGVAGLLHVQVLRARSVRTIVGVTRAAWKRDIGVASGASAVVPPEDAAGPGGTVILFGAVPSGAGLPTYEGYFKELTIRSPRASRPRDFDAAIRLCADRRLDVAPLITGRFPLAKVTEALAASEYPDHLKIVLDVAGGGS